MPAPAGPSSIFQQPWWLQAAAGPDLEQVDVVWDRVTVGTLAFVRRRKAGMTLLEMPPHTRTGGPILSLPRSKPARRMRNTHDVVQELLARLPKHDRLQMTLAPEDPAAFSLALTGCSLGQHFTFRAPGRASVEERWAELDPKTRNVVRTAAKTFEVTRGTGMDDLLALRSRHAGPQNPGTGAVLSRLAQEAESRGQGVALVARSAEHGLAAAAFLVWDDQYLYLWQSSRSHQPACAGAGSLLVWEALVLAGELGRTFDIDGYRSLEAAHFVSRFSLQPVARTNVLRMSARWRRLQALGRLVGRGGGFGVQPLAWQPVTERE